MKGCSTIGFLYIFQHLSISQGNGNSLLETLGNFYVNLLFTVLHIYIYIYIYIYIFIFSTLTGQLVLHGIFTENFHQPL
jgi:hypothetical protein